MGGVVCVLLPSGASHGRVRVTAAPGAAVSQAAGGEKKKKKAKNSGKSGGVVRGGKGFQCPQHCCDVIEDTAEALLQHAKAVHGIEERNVVDGEKVRCLWDTCGKLLACTFSSGMCGALDLFGVRYHEALLETGEPPRCFVCPSGVCEGAFNTADEALACGLAHGVERDMKRCLFDGYGLRFPAPSKYASHEVRLAVQVRELRQGAQVAVQGGGLLHRRRHLRLRLVGLGDLGQKCAADRAPRAPATQVFPNPHTLSD